MGKVFRNVSTNGRVTVPSVVRNALEIHSGDILSFEITDGAVTVRKEKFDGDSKNAVQSFIEEYGSLSEKEQREILIELSLKWAKKRNNRRLSECQKVKSLNRFHRWCLS